MYSSSNELPLVAAHVQRPGHLLYAGFVRTVSGAAPIGPPYTCRTAVPDSPADTCQGLPGQTTSADPDVS